MAKLYNLARMTTATVGTGTITLVAAATSYLTFAAAGVQDGEIVSYAIEDGANREVGIGTYTTAGLTLTRTVLASTNGGAAISLSGTAQVFIAPNALDLAPAVAWASYTPAWTSTGTAPAIGNSTFPSAKYNRVGNQVTAIVRCNFGSTATYGTGDYLFSVPVNGSTTQVDVTIGSAFFYDSSATQMYLGIVRLAATGTVKFTIAAVSPFGVGQLVPFTWATGDALSFAATYEAA